MGDSVRNAGGMIVLASQEAIDLRASTRLAVDDQADPRVRTLGPTVTSRPSTLPLKRRIAVAIAVPLCFVVLLAVLGVVLYCTKRQRPLRNGTGSRRRSHDELTHDHSDEAGSVYDARLNQREREDGDGCPTTAIKRLDDGLSRISELPSRSKEPEERRSLRQLPPSPAPSPQRLPFSLSSASDNVNALDSSSDDLAGHFSGLEEDPFSDSAVLARSRTIDESSPDVSPSSRPTRSILPTSTGSTGAGAASRSSSDNPVTTVNTDNDSSASHDEIKEEQHVRDVAEDSSEQSHSCQAVPGVNNGFWADACKVQIPVQQTVSSSTGRGNSTSAAESRRQAQSRAREDDPTRDLRSRSTHDLPLTRQLSEVSVAPSSVPAPPPSNGGSWLEERQSCEAELPSPKQFLRYNDHND